MQKEGVIKFDHCVSLAPKLRNRLTDLDAKLKAGFLAEVYQIWFIRFYYFRRQKVNK